MRSNGFDLLRMAMHRGRGHQTWESIRVAQMLWIVHCLIVTRFPEERKCISPHLFRGLCGIDRRNLPTQKHEEPFLFCSWTSLGRFTRAKLQADQDTFCVRQVAD